MFADASARRRFLVGCFLFIEFRLKTRHSIRQAVLLCPSDSRPTTRCFVELHRLGERDQAGVQRRTSVEVSMISSPSAMRPLNGLAGLATRKFSDDLKVLMHAFELALGPIPVLKQSGLAFLRLRRTGHLRIPSVGVVKKQSQAEWVLSRGRALLRLMNMSSPARSCGLVGHAQY